MRHLTVYNRFAMIIAVLTVVFVAALAAQVMILRNTVIEERRTKVFDLVEAAKKVLSNYEDKAKAGKMSADEARQLAFDAIGAMRWGQSADYLGIYGAGSTNAGVTYVHANPKYINVNRWDYKDNQGQLLIQNIVGKARTGGGFLEYQVPKAAGGPELPKLTYAGGYGEGDKLLAIQAGVYTDDIDAVVFQRALWIVAGGLAGLLVAGLAAFALGRGLVRPLGAICDVMDGLAKGDLNVEVPFVEYRNEIGHISRSLAVFKDRLIDAERLRAEREEAAARAVAAPLRQPAKCSVRRNPCPQSRRRRRGRAPPSPQPRNRPRRMCRPWPPRRRSFRHRGWRSPDRLRNRHRWRKAPLPRPTAPMQWWTGCWRRHRRSAR
jgi:methyl-accepting chemotaxis protein